MSWCRHHACHTIELIEARVEARDRTAVHTRNKGLTEGIELIRLIHGHLLLVKFLLCTRRETTCRHWLKVEGIRRLTVAAAVRGKLHLGPRASILPWRVRLERLA